MSDSTNEKTYGIWSISGNGKSIIYTPSSENPEVTTKWSYMVCTNDDSLRVCTDNPVNVTVVVTKFAPDSEGEPV